MDPKDGSFVHPEKWALEFKPSIITVCNTKTGVRIEEPSYVAIGPKSRENGSGLGRYGSTGQVLAVGKAALAYQDTKDVVVYSPFRDGQIADYGAAMCLFRALITQVIPLKDRLLFKPVLCIHAQKQTTEVEERALVDAGLQAGGRRVYLYVESLPTILDTIAQKKMKAAKDAIVIHIEPQE